ncbi:MAG: hypothetical protein M5U12_19680 [Verrucomicrobia bacterium]|nr:hypothetical protein [Verrucomicrobiota bacterium]
MGVRPGEGTEGAEAAVGQAKLEWKPVTLPGPFLRWNQDLANQTKFAWARRGFTVTREQAAGLVVLRWNRIGSGAAAFINARLVGEHEPTGPYQVIVPPGVLVAGENRIVLKIRSAGGVRKSRSGNALIPAGFGVGMPEVTDDVWLDFADRAYVKWALALPDLAGSRVRIRVTPSGLEPLDGLRITARVKSWPEGQVIGEGESAARLRPDPDPLEWPAGNGRVRDVGRPGDGARAENTLGARTQDDRDGVGPRRVWGRTCLFTQLDLQRRVTHASPSYDPAAERILLQLLGWTSPKGQ